MLEAMMNIKRRRFLRLVTAAGAILGAGISPAII
jgi:hypothetical protein